MDKSYRHSEDDDERDIDVFIWAIRRLGYSFILNIENGLVLGLLLNR